MQSSMLKAIVEDFGNGGTIDGDLTISGDLTVSGGGSLSFDEILEGTQVIDITSTEAFLVRKNNDGGNVFVVDSTNTRVGIGTAVPGALLDITKVGAVAIEKMVRIINDDEGDGTLTDRGVGIDLMIGDSGGGPSQVGQIAAWSAAENFTTGARLGFRAGNTAITVSNPHMVIDGSGSVGIGTAAPVEKLTIKEGSGSAAISFLDSDEANYMAIGMADAADDLITGSININTVINNIRDHATQSQIIFGTRNTERMRIDGAGNVGIGTAAPTGLFSIYKTGGAPEMIWEVAGNSGARNWGFRASGSAWGDFQLRQGSSLGGALDTSVITILDGGNVGIGTDSPDTLMHLESSTSLKPVLRIENTNADNHNAQLHFIKNSASPAVDDHLGQIDWKGDNLDGDLELFGRIQVDATNVTNGSETGKMMFVIRGTSNSLADRMVLDSNSRISLSNNDLGTANTIFGYQAGDDIQSGGNYNQLFGYQAGHAITTGDNNVAIGYQALDSVLTGEKNIAIGHGALTALDGAESRNIAIGYLAGDSLNNNSTVDNIFIGDSAGRAGTGADIGNIGIGSGVMQAIGGNAHTGTVGIGHQALGALTSGANNVAMGYQAMSTATTALNSVSIGRWSMKNVKAAVAADGCIAIGSSALYGNSSNDTTIGGSIALGSAALYSLQTGVGNIGIGYTALTALTTGARNLSVGYRALAAQTTGNDNIAIGYDAMLNAYNGSQEGNIAIGSYALDGLTTGGLHNCIAIGKSALSASITGAPDGTVAIGGTALGALTSGAGNTAVGYQAGDALTTEANNTILGYTAGSALTSANNTLIGSLCATTVTTGSNNTAVGYGALNAGDGDEDDNTVVGYRAGNAINDGNQNTCIGSDTDPSGATGANQTVVGYATTGVADDSVTLGNADVTDVYMAQDSGATVHCLDVAPTGGALKENLLTNSGFDVWSNSTLENVGSELVTNGTMEADTTWAAYSTPSTEERSNTQAHAGTYSWKVVTDGGDEGIRNSTAIAVTLGKLYRISVWIYNTSASRDFKITLDNSTGTLSTEVFQETIGQNAWTEISAVVECTESGNISTQEIRIIDSGTTAYIDDFSIYEVTPGCVGANNKAMDGWIKEDNTQAKIYRQHSDGDTESVSKLGSFYSLKLVASADTYIQWPSAAVRDNPDWYSRFAGRTVTFGCWVKGETASDVRLSIYDGTHRQSSLNTGTGWEWIEYTYACPSTITTFQVNILCDVANTVLDGSKAHYFSQPMLVFGNSIGSGNYTRPQGEIIYCEANPTIHSNTTPVAADDKVLNLEALSSGKIPKGIAAVYISGEVQNSSITSDQGIRYGKDEATGIDVVIYPSVNAVRQRGNGWCRCNSDGDIHQEVTEAGATLSSLFLNATAIQLK